MSDPQDATDSSRDKLANNVVWWSGLGIVVVSAAVLLAAVLIGGKAEFKEVATTVFNTLIPLFGTWVGTVLAFYFSSKNFESAAKSTKELVQHFGDERLKQILVKDAWIAVAAIDAITVAPGAENTVPFATVRAKLSSRVTRVPIWDANKVVRFIIHESTIFEFLAAHAEADAAAVRAAAAGALPATPAPTLEDFLNHVSDGTPMRTIVSKIAWVAQGATLADAKAKMEGTPDCQDVFVTDTGAATEPVLGWITNADLAKKSRA